MQRIWMWWVVLLASLSVSLVHGYTPKSHKTLLVSEFEGQLSGKALNRLIEYHRSPFEIDRFKAIVEGLNQPLGNEMFQNLDNPKRNAFYALSIKNDTDKTAVFKMPVGFAITERVEAWFVSGAPDTLESTELIGVYQQGQLVKPAERSDQYRYSVIPIEVSPHQTQTVFIRVFDTLDPGLYPTLLSELEFEAYYGFHSKMTATALVIFGVALLIAVIRGLFRKQKPYFGVSLGLLGVCSFGVAREGFAPLLMPDLGFWMQNHGVVLGFLAVTAAMSLMARYFFVANGQPKWFDRVSMVVIGISILLTVPFVLGMVSEPLAVNVNFLNIFLLLFTANAVALKSTSSRFSMHEQKVAKFYLLSWAPMALIIVVVLASLKGFLPAWIANSWIIEASMVLHFMACAAILEWMLRQNDSHGASV